MSKHVQGRTSSPRIKRLVLVGIIVTVFALGATAAVSLRGGEAKKSTPQTNGPQPESARSTHFRADAQVPLDPQTGQVRPLTQEEAQRLAEGIKKLVNQSTDGLESVQHADGSVSVDLQGRFQNVAVAKLDENGNLIQSCIDNPAAAAAFFGIDPQLVGVQKGATASTPNSPALSKGEVK